MRILKYLPVFLLVGLASCGGDQEADQQSSTEPNTNTISPQEDSLNQVLRENPDNFQAYLQRANIKFEDSRFEAAIGDATRAIEVDSTQPEAHLVKGRALFAMEDFFNAQKSYELCLEMDAKYVPCLEKLAELNLLRKNYDKAMDFVNRSLRVNEQNYYPYYLKGWIYMEQGDSATAASSFQTAVELNPEFYTGYIMLGNLYYQANHPLCEQYFVTALELLPSSTEAMYFLAMYYQQNNQPQPAISYYKRMISVDQSDVRPWHNIGFVNLTLTQQYDSAVYYFDKAITMAPDYYQAYYNRGTAYLEQGKTRLAAEDFQAAIDINRDYTLAIKALNKINGEG